MYRFDMPVPPEVLATAEEIVRKSDVLTFFDQSFDASNALRYRYEQARFGTQSMALLDLNCFKDILALGREDRSRTPEQRRLAAAMCLFFQCADICLEPGSALHESPDNAAEELSLFRRIDNAEPADLARIMMGTASMIPIDCVAQNSPEPVTGDIARTLRGDRMTEIALLKLASLIRRPGSNMERLEAFLRWCLDDFIFVREPVTLAFHQLTGNLPKPVLRGLTKQNPADRLAGIRNAVWDMLLLRNWREKLEEQDEKGRLWLLCSRDSTLSRLARKLVVVTDDPNQEAQHRREMFESLWGASNGRRIATLYDHVVSEIGSSHRKASEWDVEIATETMLRSLRADLMS